MALSDLTLRQVERYGGIDLKRNYTIYFGGGLGMSIGLHLLVFLLYIGYSWLTHEDEVGPLVTPLTNVNFLPPPQSLTEDFHQAVPLDAPQPQASVRPDFGVPVPVPKAVDVGDVMPVIDIPIPNPGEYGDPVYAVEKPSPVTISIPAEKTQQILDKTIFVDYSEAPKPVIDIQKLIVYPEFAKRTGIEGTVTVSALIGIDGRVRAVDIEQSTSQWLIDAAREAMMKARFTPALQGDEPVEVWYTQKIQFKLSSGN